MGNRGRASSIRMGETGWVKGLTLLDLPIQVGFGESRLHHSSYAFTTRRLPGNVVARRASECYQVGIKRGGWGGAEGKKGDNNNTNEHRHHHQVIQGCCCWN